MPWMVKWAGPFPPYVDTAEGAHFRCVDGHDYVDLCLGDTGAWPATARPRRSRRSSARSAAASPTCSRPRMPPGSARS